jgi:hypothetical protein
MSHSWATLGVVRGPEGPQGPQGNPGTPGTNGTNGSNGTNGLSILSGARAPTNSDGLPGEFWLRTDTTMLYGPKGASAWPAGVSLVGPTGPQGNPGATGGTGSTGATGAAGLGILSGARNPTASDGRQGEFWLNTATTALWGPKGASAWPGSGVSLIGPQGQPGTLWPGAVPPINWQPNLTWQTLSPNPAGVTGHVRYRQSLSPACIDFDVVLATSGGGTYTFPNLPSSPINYGVSLGTGSLARIYTAQGNAGVTTGQGIGRFWLSGTAVQYISSPAGATLALNITVPQNFTNT